MSPHSIPSHRTPITRSKANTDTRQPVKESRHTSSSSGSAESPRGNAVRPLKRDLARAPKELIKRCTSSIAQVSVAMPVQGLEPKQTVSVAEWMQASNTAGEAVDITRLSDVTQYLKDRGHELSNVEFDRGDKNGLENAAAAIRENLTKFMTRCQDSMRVDRLPSGKAIQVPDTLCLDLSRAFCSITSGWNGVLSRTLNGSDVKKTDGMRLLSDQDWTSLERGLNEALETLRQASPSSVQYPQKIEREQIRWAEISDGTTAVKVQELSRHLENTLNGKQQLCTNDVVGILQSETHLARRAVELGTGADKRVAMIEFYEHTAQLKEAVLLWNATAAEVDQVLGALDQAIGAWGERMDKHGCGSRVSEQQADFRAELTKHWRETGVLPALGQ